MSQYGWPNRNQSCGISFPSPDGEKSFHLKFYQNTFTFIFGRHDDDLYYFIDSDICPSSHIANNETGKNTKSNHFPLFFRLSIPNCSPSLLDWPQKKLSSVSVAALPRDQWIKIFDAKWLFLFYFPQPASVLMRHAFVTAANYYSRRLATARSTAQEHLKCWDRGLMTPPPCFGIVITANGENKLLRINILGQLGHNRRSVYWCLTITHLESCRAMTYNLNSFHVFWSNFSFARSR